MAVATGKTSAKHIRVYADDAGTSARDMSASVSSVTGAGATYAENDITGYSDGVINYTMGHPSMPIELSGPLDNTADVGSYVVHRGRIGYETTTSTLTIQIGIRAAPTNDCPEFEGEYLCSSFVIDGDGNYTSRWVPGSSTAPAWGVMS